MVERAPDVAKWVQEKLAGSGRKAIRKQKREDRWAEEAEEYERKRRARLLAGLPPDAPDDEEEAADEGAFKRPFLQRGLMTQTDKMRAQIDKIMAHPEREVKIPVYRAPTAPKVREFNKDVMGSSAGAGSGEFHVYRASKRREEDRIKYVLDTESKTEAQREFEQAKEAAERELEEKTAKKRAKRQKMKNKKRQKGNGEGSAAGDSKGKDDDNDDDDDDEEEEDEKSA